MKNFDNRIALITGASSGIGRETALQLADLGCDMVLCARRKGALEDVAEQVTRKGRRALVVETDVSDEQQVIAAAHTAKKTFGRVDILILNAGIGWTGPTHLMETADWERVIGVNLYGAIYFIRHFVHDMIVQGDGHIVLISSAFGLTGIPYGTLYSTTKYGLVGLGECLRSEMARHNIGVTTFCPGYVATDIISNTELKDVDEAARSLATRVKPMSVEKCVRILIRGIRKNRGLVVVTPVAKLLWYTKRVSQRFYEAMSVRIAQSTGKHVHDEKYRP